MARRQYQKPRSINFTEEVINGVPGALWGAALMVGRAVAAAMKGGIDLVAGTNVPKTLQRKKK